MNISINDIILKLKQNNNLSLENEIKLLKAYKLAYLCHYGVNRKSGEPFITHPLSVAYTLASKNEDINLIVAALLHDTVEDTELTIKDIEKEFGKDVSNLVDGVTKIKEKCLNETENEMLSQAKLTNAMQKDKRLIKLKVADRLHNMQTLDSMSDESKLRNSKETILIFEPLARYVSYLDISEAFRELSLKYLTEDNIKWLVSIKDNYRHEYGLDKVLKKKNK